MTGDARFRGALCALLVVGCVRVALGFPHVVQEHYHWRNDDGSETEATWKTILHDTPYLKLVAGESIRLRIALSNYDGLDHAVDIRPQLVFSDGPTNEYRVVSPSPVSAVAFRMVATPHYANGDTATPQLTARGTPRNGACTEAPMNHTGALTLEMDHFANYEYCFEATTNAPGGETFYFKVIDIDNTKTAKWYEWQKYAKVLVVSQPDLDNGLGATDIGVTSARLNGQIESSRGEDPRAWFFWGPTDGGKDENAWSNRLDVGIHSGSFSTHVTGFVANATIFYRSFAANLAGGAWAPQTASFITSPTPLSYERDPVKVVEDASSVVFRVVQDIPSELDTFITIATSNGTADAGLDYDTTNGVLTWLAGETGARSLRVGIREDDHDESDESIRLVLNNASNCAPPAAPGTISITDNDGLPTVQFAGGAASGDESVTNVFAEVEVVPPSDREVAVDYVVFGGTATPGEDYVLTSGTARIQAQATGVVIRLEVLDDDEYEDPETVILSLSRATNAVIGSTDAHTYTITDLDSRPPRLDNWKGAARIFATSARLRGSVVDTGRNDPAVSIFWGPSDGGTNADAWSNRIDLGTMGSGVFETDITNLVTGTQYFYRTHGTNVAGEGWAGFSENLTARDPPSFLLLDNESMEISDGGASSGARSWLRYGSDTIERVDAFPRTGTYSIRFPSATETYLYGIDRNLFVVSWDGHHHEGAPHPGGGVRPGYTMHGMAHIRAQVVGTDTSVFSYVWHNVSEDANWMSNSIPCYDVVYADLPVSNTGPVSVADTGDRCVPVVGRVTKGTGVEDNFHVDDVSMQVMLPRMNLEYDTTVPVGMDDTIPGAFSEVSLGVRNQGGAPESILYGSYLPSASRAKDPAWPRTAWIKAYDPSNAFQIVSGAALTATNDAGYQYVTIRFAPPSAGSFTGVVRVATSDPNDRYTGGGVLFGSIPYEQYVIIGNAIPPPSILCANTSVREGNTGYSAANFVVSLESNAVAEVAVNFATSNGTAVAGEDYVSTSGRAVIPIGQRSTTVTVFVRGDVAGEPSEFFYLVLDAPQNAVLDTDPGLRTCWIRDDESTLIILR
jgi:hypothetical protein